MFSSVTKGRNNRGISYHDATTSHKRDNQSQLLQVPGLMEQGDHCPYAVQKDFSKKRSWSK